MNKVTLTIVGIVGGLVNHVRGIQEKHFFWRILTFSRGICLCMRAFLGSVAGVLFGTWGIGALPCNATARC